MEYQFRPYALFEPITVKLTGKVYEKGEHPIYKDHKIIEVCDDEGNINDAFEDELNVVLKETIEEVAKKYFNNFDKRKEEFAFIDGAKWQAERSYTEEELHKIIESYQNVMENNPIHTHYNKWFEQFKKK